MCRGRLSFRAGERNFAGRNAQARRCPAVRVPAAGASRRPAVLVVRSSVGRRPQRHLQHRRLVETRRAGGGRGRHADGRTGRAAAGHVRSRDGGVRFRVGRAALGHRPELFDGRHAAPAGPQYGPGGRLLRGRLPRVDAEPGRFGGHVQRVDPPPFLSVYRAAGHGTANGRRQPEPAFDHRHHRRDQRRGDVHAAFVFHAVFDATEHAQTLRAPDRAQMLKHIIVILISPYDQYDISF